MNKRLGIYLDTFGPNFLFADDFSLLINDEPILFLPATRVF
jgi:hypothetical protein